MKRTLLAGLLLGMAACGATQAEDSLTVAAAASLAPAFDALEPSFEEQTGIELTIAYGATGSLAEQIRNGGPFDLFASADAERVDVLIAQSLLDGETRTVFARGHLVLVASPILSYSVDSLEALTGSPVSKIALANPEHAPYGMAAWQALDRTGLAAIVEPKLVYAESVRQAGQMVISGNASAGLIAASTAESLHLPMVEVPSQLYAPIDHVIAVQERSQQHDLALQFIDFLSGPVGTSTLQAYGLSPPDR